jgi:hypothetical protein
MKLTPTVFRFLTTIALSMWALGCASHFQDKVNIAVAADFKVITPSKPDQQEILRKLPADKVTLIDYEGKPYYVLPDLKNNRAYVGGPKQYEEYQRLRRIQLQNSSNVEPTPVVDNTLHVHQVNWSGWGGWGGVGRYGWY